MRIPPNFNLSKIVWNYLSEIEKKREVFNRGDQISEQQWQRLISENLLQSSLYSAKIEGNPLELRDISRLSIKKREHLEVRNIIRALKYIKKNIHQNQKITVKFIARLHAITMYKIDEDAGRIRKKQNAIFNKDGFVVYMPPPPAEANILLKRLIKYINSKKHEEAPLAKAIIAHFIFEKIHPFVDGNGRVGRLLIYAILKINESDELKSISFEEKLNAEKENYYYYLDNDKNVTAFVEFMLNVINESYDVTLHKLESRMTDDALLPRRQEIWQIIRDHKIVSVDFLKRRFQDISERTLRNDLADLAERKLVVKLGKTRGAAYRIGTKT
jgi:Fic family protein